MKRNVVAIGLFTVSIFSTLAFKEAKSDELDEVVTLCKANPNCAHGTRDQNGKMLIYVNVDGMSISLSCSSDGECMRIIPKGKRIAVANEKLLVSAR